MYIGKLWQIARVLNSWKCTTKNYVKSIYNITKVVLLLCCSSLQARFIALLSCFLPWLQFPSIEQDLLVMAWGVLEIAVFIECIWWCGVHSCIIVCLYGFFSSSHCGFHLSFGSHNNHNILIDVFISQLPLASKMIPVPLLYIPKVPCHQHEPLCVSENLFKAGNASNHEWSSQPLCGSMRVLLGSDYGHCFWRRGLK